MSDVAPTSGERRDPEWWERRYAAGDVPWDTGKTPPEIVDLVRSGRVQRGWALDLGCGSGVTSRYLAAHGFRVVGLDLSLLALRRAQQAADGLPCYFLRASVADLGFLKITGTFAADVGCFHSLALDQRISYVRSVAEHLIPGGYYLLYTFLQSASVPGAMAADGPAAGPAVTLTDIAAFAPRFTLLSTAHGEDRGRLSAWFLMQRA